MVTKRLTPEELKTEQQKTLSRPRMRYGFLARLLFVGMDVFYGRRRRLSKFKVLEIIARVPYQAWESVAYIAITHMYPHKDFARRVFERVAESRHAQDNEQWHLLILEDLTHQRDIKESFFWYRLLPQFVAFFYYHVSWLLYVINPSLAYQLNAWFEDHAEHEYMAFVAENPGLEAEPFESTFEQDYGAFASLADLFRQIGYDERVHKEESLSRTESARFE